jgi:hypothetical protein
MPVVQWRNTRNVGEFAFLARSSNSRLCLVFSRHDYMGPPLAKLLDIIAYVKPTALLGLSTTKVRIFSYLLYAGSRFDSVSREHFLRTSLRLWLP